MPSYYWRDRETVAGPMDLREPFGKKLDKRQLNMNDTQETYTCLHTQILYATLQTWLTELNEMAKRMAMLAHRRRTAQHAHAQTLALRGSRDFSRESIHEGNSKQNQRNLVKHESSNGKWRTAQPHK